MHYLLIAPGGVIAPGMHYLFIASELHRCASFESESQSELHRCASFESESQSELQRCASFESESQKYVGVI